MKTIHRYPLTSQHEVWRSSDSGAVHYKIPMPKHSTLLHAGISRGDLCVWALVNTAFSEQARLIAVFGTGREFNLSGYEHVQSVQHDGIVHHVFDGAP